MLFVFMLWNEFEKLQMVIKQANEDADVLILNTDLFFAVIVNGEEIDIHILVASLTLDNVYFRKTRRGKLSEYLFSNKCLQFKEVAQNILFINALKWLRYHCCIL